MTQYLLSVPMIDGAPPRLPDDMQQAYEGVARFNAELESAGAWVFAGGLLPASSATVVRAQGGRGPDDGRALHRVKGAHRRGVDH